LRKKLGAASTRCFSWLWETFHLNTCDTSLVVY
jgi:hypothetical protein